MCRRCRCFPIQWLLLDCCHGGAAKAITGIRQRQEARQKLMTVILSAPPILQLEEYGREQI